MKNTKKDMKKVDLKYIKEIEERIIYRLQQEFPESMDLVQSIIEENFNHIFKRLPSPPTRTVTDEEIEKEFPLWEMPLDNTSAYEENVINQHKRDAVKWMRDKANTPKV